MPHLTTSATIILLALALVLLPGCGREDTPAASVNGNAGNVSAATNHPPALRTASLDPGITAVSVDRLIRNMKDYSGFLAVHGVVVQSHEERGAFVMVDEEEFKSCGLDACTDATMPVRVARDQYEGALPQPGRLVTLVGNFQPLERGFQFDLHEVHREGSVILARRPDAGQ